ncbi:MAG: hypothetical protein SGBAC_000762 [Bacillariaceae sp.]
MPEQYDVIIVGAGVAGVSAAYHLTKAGYKDGRSPNILVIDGGPSAGEGWGPRKSGTATMNDSPISKIKMMTQLFAVPAVEDFARHHGAEGALAKELQTDCSQDEEILTEMGSYYVCYPKDRDDLYTEYQFYKKFDCCKDWQFVDTDHMSGVSGSSPDFSHGIYFPDDAVIDSSEYAKRLLKSLTSKEDSTVTTLFNTKVTKILDNKRSGGVVILESGETLNANDVVVATGALGFAVTQLHGLIKPCYSYLADVSIDNPRYGSVEESANFFTWGYSHDWCFTGGKVRVSGEDHFSAYKEHRCEERCGRMIDWVRTRYKCDPIDDSGKRSIPQQYGLYSETPDAAPLVGKISDDSSLCYLLGCNAWGQAILSCCASLVPGILASTGTNGGAESGLTKFQQDLFKIMDLRRFSELPH